ncbi:hypothetical protein GS601_22655 [Myxacorys almedinensis A]|uniref:Uncharacterized protein n=1 Tax=Myxacorys almedinensis A TaxID=2690445 RepID=A0A8J7ZDF2_9CYAN|nr:hypothetical protein [Myxacorys almedinensis A]
MDAGTGRQPRAADVTSPGVRAVRADVPGGADARLAAPTQAAGRLGGGGAPGLASPAGAYGDPRVQRRRGRRGRRRWQWGR